MQRTPGMYTSINTQTQRTGLTTQDHSIVLVTSDVGAPTNPTPVYDTATADAISGDNSNAGRMIAAALTVSQGVRVETLGKSDAGSQQNTVNFLKLQNDQQINGNDGDVAGLVYSIDGGEITATIVPLGIEQFSTMYSFLPTLVSGDAYLAYGRDGGFGWSDADMPDGLDVDKFYYFGLNALMSQAFFATRGVPVPDGAIPTEVVITVYPASRLPSGAPSPSGNIDYDIFDLIIDPANYTAGDLQYFASKGITPAVKNLDGSYTLKSQLTLPRPPIPV